MAKTFRPYVPEQDFLLPPSLRAWLPADHLTYFVSEFVDQLDLSAILAPYEREERGYPPYHPVMLTKVLRSAYSVGVCSSRRIQRRLSEDVAFRVFAADNHPDFRTIADFRQRHLTALDSLFVQVLRLAREAGAVRVGRVAIDGSKVRANASKDTAQDNFTDPESRIMKGPDGFVQAYNAQIAVEATSQLIVRHAVTQEVNDTQQLVPRIETVVAQAGDSPDEVLADSGYCSDANLEQVAARGVDAFIATERLRQGTPPPAGRGPLPRGATLTDRMRRKLWTKRGGTIYRRRKTIVEPVFGQIKHARGFRQFLLRGVEKVRGEWTLVCLTHNVLKYDAMAGA